MLHCAVAWRGVLCCGMLPFMSVMRCGVHMCCGVICRCLSRVCCLACIWMPVDNQDVVITCGVICRCVSRACCLACARMLETKPQDLTQRLGCGGARTHTRHWRSLHVRVSVTTKCGAVMGVVC
jgi:hypothetical protein